MCFILLFAAMVPSAAIAAPERIFPEVDDLFQRVAVNPGADFYDSPGGSVIDEPDAFSVYYVFDRTQRGGETWLHVGASASRDASAWLKSSESTELRHLLVLGPQSRQNRERALFFESSDDLSAVATSRNRVSVYEDMIAEVDAGDNPDGVLGIQPENQPAMADAFSFMPIRSVETVFASRLSDVRLFETLSIPLPPDGEGTENFRTAVVFVVDTTISMGPYIDGVRDMMRQVSDSLLSVAQDDQVSFGLVAFRDDADLTPGLEYTQRTALRLSIPFDPAAFDRAISDLEEASVSTPLFEEDALAGLEEALSMTEWEDFEKRIIVLVTDAHTRAGFDSSTNLPLEHFQNDAEEKRITIATIYLSTPSGTAYHREGRRQYRNLSRWENGASAFLEIPNGEFQTYSADLDRLIRGVTDMLGSDSPDCSSTGRLSDVDRVLCEIEDRTAAVRMEWIGRREGVAAPAISTAWVSDVSLDSANATSQRMAFQPYLLLTRNQLNDMVRVLERLVDVVGTDIDSNREEVLEIFQGAFSRGAVSIDALRAAAPSASGTLPTISDYDRMSYFLPAFLSELPLRSPFMELEVSAWINPNEQAAHMLSIRGKLIEFWDYLEDDSRWIALSEGAEHGDMVYPIPWDRIP